MRILKNGLSRKEQNTLITKYLLDAINYSEYTVSGIDASGNIVELPIVCNSDKDKVNFVMADFDRVANYPNNIRNIPNRQHRFADWLMGLPSTFSVDYENYRIIEIAKVWGSIADTATDRECDKITANWFNFIAFKFLSLYTKLNKVA